jgi:hypothetical protein
LISTTSFARDAYGEAHDGAEAAGQGRAIYARRAPAAPRQGTVGRRELDAPRPATGLSGPSLRGIGADAGYSKTRNPVCHREAAMFARRSAGNELATFLR